MRLAWHEVGKEGMGQVLQHFGNQVKRSGFYCNCDQLLLCREALWLAEVAAGCCGNNPGER